MRTKQLTLYVLAIGGAILTGSLLLFTTGGWQSAEAAASKYNVDDSQAEWSMFVSALTEGTSPLYSMIGSAGEATVGGGISPNYSISGGFLEVTTCCDLPGDANDDGSVDIADLTFFVDFMFGGGMDPTCRDEADIDGSGELDITDLTYRVDFMFGEGPAPVCGPAGQKN